MLARFVPVVRTVITVMAGVSGMNARLYAVFSAVGGAAHSIRNVGATPGRYLAFHAPAGLERFFAALGTPVGAVAPAGPPDRERLMTLAREYGVEFVGPLPAAAGR